MDKLVQFAQLVGGLFHCVDAPVQKITRPCRLGHQRYCGALLQRYFPL